MLDFLMKNLGTIIILIVLASVVLLIIFRMYKNHKKGKTACGCGCDNCPSAKICHKK